MMKLIQKLLLCILLCCGTAFANKAFATHVYGADFYYTWVSGNTYKITLTVFGDCAGAAFPNLQAATPNVYIFNGATQVSLISLAQQGPAVEVTPVCAGQANQTACFIPGSSIPGIKRYIYSANYTLSGPSTNWRFFFNGDMPSPSGSTSAGRSNSITNIVSGTTMALEATLNNTAGNNSSPVYTTIPTPFFCVNKPGAYNPGTVDPNSDLLSFALVPGLVAGTPPGSGGTVTYTGLFSPTAPLSVVPASLIFNNTNGQLDFTPNATQKSLVVSRVSETRAGVVVGTSMREMTFVVLPCLNNPPGGVISGPSAGVTVLSSTTLSVCKEQGLFTFNINPTDADGDTINVTAAGLPAGATFNLGNNNTPSPTGLFSWDVSSIAPGNYTFFITYTDAGCPLASKQTIAYTITVLPNPTLTYALVSAATCTRKAVFRVTPVGTDVPYTITFGPTTRTGVNGQITDSLSPGTYTFTITGANGCSHDTSINIVSPATIIPAAVVRKSICSTLANGSVTLSASNGAAPYTYAQGAGPYTANTVYTPLAAGAYTFHIKDVQGCVKDTTIVIADSFVISGVVTVTDVLCNGQTNGTIQVTGAGGTSPYTYAFGAGTYGTAGTFPSLAAGTYALHIKDNLGCIKDTNAAVAQPAIITPAVTITDVTCNGGSNGRVTVAVTGGTPGYSYALGTGAFGTAASFTNLTAGTYTVHIRDANNCTKDTVVTVAQPTPLTFTLALTNVLCFGGSTGTVTVTAGGGTPVYSYAADAGLFGSSNVLNGLNAGAHIIHLRDANGCTKDTTVTLTQPAVLKLSYTSADPSCNAGTNGTITVTGTGGTTPYQFALNANAFGASGAFTGLAAGTYTLHLKDANGCTKDSTATLNQPTPITVSAAVRRPRCTPLVNGAVTITAGGGSPGYTYARDAGAYGTANLFTGLGSGTYVFHIKDTHSCVKDTTITVTDSVFLHATTVMTPVSCFAGTNGTLTITPSGGDTAYTYALNAGAYTSANPRTGLAAGTYVLHVKDANGCVLDTNVSVTQPTIVVPAVTITQPLCYLDSNGVVVAGGSGGTPGYTYALGTGAYGAATSFPNLKAGSYTIHVKDANGCIRDTSFTVGQPTELLYTFLILTHVHCFNGTDGTVTVRGTGGTPAYTFAADATPFQASRVLSNLNAGTHVIHLKDANGCQRDTSVALLQPTQTHVLITDVISPTCEGYKDGTVRIAGTGGTPGYTYSTNNTSFDTQKTYSMLPEGRYRFYLKDANGCISDTTMDLTGYPHININGAAVTEPSCYGLKDGAFALNVTGGNQPLTYVMMKPRDTSMTGAYDSLVSGKYSIRITDSKGCFKDTSVTVNQPDSLHAATTVMANDCEGYDDAGGVATTVTGGTGPYTYLWSTTPAQSGDHISGMPNGKYYVIVTDAHECSDTAKATVAYDNCCKPYIPNAFTPNADGKNDKFRVRFKGDIKLENFSVFNRYGQRLFYTTNFDEGWDGTWNSQPQDMGTYFYYIKLICGNKGDNVQEFKGDVTLVR